MGGEGGEACSTGVGRGAGGCARPSRLSGRACGVLHVAGSMAPAGVAPRVWQPGCGPDWCRRRESEWSTRVVSVTRRWSPTSSHLNCLTDCTVFQAIRWEDVAVPSTHCGPARNGGPARATQRCGPRRSAGPSGASDTASPIRAAPNCGPGWTAGPARAVHLAGPDSRSGRRRTPGPTRAARRCSPGRTTGPTRAAKCCVQAWLDPRCRHRRWVRASPDPRSDEGRTTLQPWQDDGAHEGRSLLYAALAGPPVRRAQRRAAALAGPHGRPGPHVVPACRPARPLQAFACPSTQWKALRRPASP